MKRIEDLLKSKLSGTKAQADPAMDDALWEKVSSGLNAPTPENAVKTGSSIGWKLAAIGGGFLFTAGIGVGLLLDLEPSEYPTAKTELVASEDERSVQELGIADVGNESAPANTPVKQPVPLQESEEAIADQFTTIVTPPPPPAASSSTSVSTSDLVLDDSEDAPEKSLESVPSNTETVAPRSMKNTQTGSAKIVSAEQRVGNHSEQRIGEVGEFSPEENSNRIPPILEMKPIHVAFAYDCEKKILQNVNPSNSQNTRPYALRAFGGITLSNFKYVNDNLVAYSDHFFTASSTGAGMALDFDYKNQQWSVGLGWLDFAQRLEFEHTWQTQFVEPEGVLSVELDPVSGDTLSVQTGPILVTATHQRHVRDFNHWNAIVVPLEWRKEWLVSRWTLGTGLGGQLQFRTGAHGQTFLNTGSLERFQDADLAPVRISWAPTARFYIGYQIQPEWRIDFSATTGFQSFNARRDQDVMNPALTPWDGRLHTVQISAGVTRYFELVRPRTVK